MPLSMTIGPATTTVSGGPFPPNYPVGANGYIAAGSNPTGDSAGTLSPAVYYTAPILAIANDQPGTAATKLLVAIQGTFDQTFLGNVTSTDGEVYESSQATLTQSIVNGTQVTTWCWPIQGAPLSGTTFDATVVSGASFQFPFTGEWESAGTGYVISDALGLGGPAGSLTPNVVIGGDALVALGNVTFEGSNYVIAVMPTGFSASISQIQLQKAGGAVNTYLVSGATYTPGNPPFGVPTGYECWMWLTTNHDFGTGLSTAVVITATNSDTIVFGDTGDALLSLTGQSNQLLQINLDWINYGPTPPENYLLYRGIGSAAPTLYQTLGGTVLTYSDTGLEQGTPYNYYVQAEYTDGTFITSPTEAFFTPSDPGLSDEFNCNCESQPLPADGFTIDTLGNLRARVAIRCGYAAQAHNLPAGMVALINEFLRDAQNQLYRQHSEFRNKRLYAWQMEPNVRYYGFQNDESDCRRLDPLSVDWVGFEDLNQAWYPLIKGIDPVLYTRAQISTGWPTHYDLRSCIEIFPAPRAAYTLWVKGRFGLDPFAADTDCTTVDAEAVYLLACGLMKAHYGQVDAQAVLTQAMNWTKYLVAGQHATQRYVPRTRVQTPMTPPRFLPLES